MRVLHITYWYPTTGTPYTALWIKRHIQSLSNHCDNKVVHLEVKKGSFSIAWNKKELLGNNSFVVSLPFQVWTFTEFIIHLMVLWILRKHKHQFDLVNFHIAYPLCLNLEKIKQKIRKPIIITEHWSAYHFHFGIKGSPKLQKIKNIFQYADRVITVSHALKNDIVQFIGHEKLSFAIVPNIVDTSVFRFEQREIKNKSFFMVSQWKDPKDPFSVLRVFKELSVLFPDIHLRIGGYGPQEEKILQLVDELDLSHHVTYLGKLTSMEIAEEMRNAMAFIHTSDYETFSVVCAEAICCGCPVIASNVGGIKEFINTTNGVLIESSTELQCAISESVTRSFDRKSIAQAANELFNEQKVGQKYWGVLRTYA